MRPPGLWLRAAAARLCDTKAMNQLIDPIVADLQYEHAEARRAGAIWRSRRIRLAGGLRAVRWRLDRVATVHARMRNSARIPDSPVLTKAERLFGVVEPPCGGHTHGAE